MSFIQGINGINSAAQALDVIGNNIANSQTIGFKSSYVSFSDIFSGSMVGLGSQLSNVTQNFASGSMVTGSKNLDMAISGNGFFRLSDSGGKIYFTRNGEFKLNSHRQIVNLQNKFLTGYQARGNPPSIDSGSSIENIIIPSTSMNPVVSTEGEIHGNLKSDVDVPKNSIFNIKNPKSYNFTTQLEAYDSLGKKHVIKIFFVKQEAQGNWMVHGYDETSPIVDDSKNIKTNPILISFDENGNLKKSENSNKYISIDGSSLDGSDPLKVEINLEEMTQYSSDNQINYQKINGHGVGKFNDYNVSDSGKIIANYSNGQTQLIAQIAMANFTNNLGLTPNGENCWLESAESGPAIIGLSETGSFGRISGQKLESSNVDISNELVKMMTQQSNYQSNAQTIKTQDQLLQILVNMK
ncbi:flgE [Wigglesworthia glossinidia endosymbiont of Glossina brevipalpis]|uniref:Flagellar hook protein FlgE n=1 Tax=Wigglesworthia glossinidia brevipalpis TaxID=36870 RepID=Q8D3G0_WIGBR|nr:flgE [Wigglesworthia glossinidia endosymbiont of Glossina brevipalpis]